MRFWNGCLVPKGWHRTFQVLEVKSGSSQLELGAIGFPNRSAHWDSKQRETRLADPVTLPFRPAIRNGSHEGWPPPPATAAATTTAAAAATWAAAAAAAAAAAGKLEAGAAKGRQLLLLAGQQFGLHVVRRAGRHLAGILCPFFSSFVRFRPLSSSFTEYLPRSTHFYLALPSFGFKENEIEGHFYRFLLQSLPKCNKYCWIWSILLCIKNSIVFTEFYWVLPSFTGFYWVSLDFTGLYRVLLGFT